MTQLRTGFVSKSRLAASSEVDARRAWLTLLTTLRDHVGRTLSGVPIDKFEAMALANLTVRHKSRFPVAQASALNIAEAILHLARGFVAAGTPDARQAVARILDPALAHLDRVLIDDGHAMAARSRLRAGDTD